MRYNTNLDFERADHYMLNYQKIRNGYTFRVEGYYKKYLNLVKTDAVTELANNGGSGYAQGLDVFFRDTKTIRHGDYWISYSYLDTKRDYRDFPRLATPTFASAHNASVVYKHWIGKWNTAVGATYSYTSGRPFNDPNSGGFNTGKTIDYHDLSVNVAYLTNWRGNFITTYFSCTNVLGFDQMYGYRFSSSPDGVGRYLGLPIVSPARRMLFFGVFVSPGKRFVKDKGGNDDV